MHTFPLVKLNISKILLLLTHPIIQSTDVRARSYERFSSLSGVNNAFEFDSKPLEDHQQIHWRSSEAGKRVRGFFTELYSIYVKFDFGFGRPPTNSYRLWKTAYKFVGGLLKGLSQIRRH